MVTLNNSTIPFNDGPAGLLLSPVVDVEGISGE
jgi:hypothetical protein